MPTYPKSRLQNSQTILVKTLKSRRRALLKALIHIIPLAITIGVLSLTFRNVFWSLPSERTNVILNSLQFAAQFHASIIVASLSAMLLHLTHQGLSSKKGVPLGFISSSFQLASLVYVFRREFTSLRRKYILIYLVAFILAITSNPSSAIVMLPRLQFWSVDKVWLNKGSVDFRVYVEATEKVLYPEVLTNKYVPSRCFLPDAMLDAMCPTYGLRRWMMDEDLFAHVSPRINKTIQGTWTRYLVGALPDSTSGEIFYAATTLSTFLGNALITYHRLVSTFGQQAFTIIAVGSPTTVQAMESDSLASRYDLSLRVGDKTIPTRRPFVAVECAGYTARTSTLPLLHGGLQQLSSSNWSISASDYSDLIVDLNSTKVNSSWINIEQFGDVKPSLGAFFSMPEATNPTRCLICNYTTGRDYSLYTCTIAANWMTTRVFTDASSGTNSVHDFDLNPLGTRQKDNQKNQVYGPQIVLSESWVKALDVPWIDSIADPETTNRTLLGTLAQECLHRNTFYNATSYGRPFKDNTPHLLIRYPTLINECLQAALSIYLTEAIARVQETLPIYLVTEAHNVKPKIDDPLLPKSFFTSQSLYENIDQYKYHEKRNRTITKAEFEDPTRFTEIYMPLSRWGYGWGFQDSILVYVGVTILLVHVGLTVVYVGWILGKGDFLAVGWESMGELLAMAFQSGGGGEIEMVGKYNERAEKRMWNAMFGVREVVIRGEGHGKNTDEGERVLIMRKVGKDGGSDCDVENSGKTRENVVL